MTNNSGELLNKKGVDTPRIENLSNSTDSTYVLELKNYDINITANYDTIEYKLKLEINTDKGTLSPEGASLTYNTLASFNAAKDSIYNAYRRV